MSGAIDFKALGEHLTEMSQRLDDSRLEMNIQWIEQMEYLKLLAKGITPENKSRVIHMMSDHIASVSKIISKTT